MIMVERYPIGEKTDIGHYAFTEERILSFARRFDPQRFHVDTAAAKESLFGGLCASGWHTSAAWMQVFLAYWKVESERLTRGGSVPPNLGPSPGFRNMQWIRPVFAGEVVHYSNTLLASRALASRPGMRLNTILSEGAITDGTPVIRFEGSVLEFE